MFTDLPEIVASSYGADIDRLITVITWIVGIWFVAAEGLLLWFLFRYRQRPGQRAAWLPADSLRMSAWVLVPAAIVLVLDLHIETASHHVWQKIKGDIPEYDMEVRIEARQFAWTFTYPGLDGEFDTADDLKHATELHVPEGRVVRFTLESVDVLHSFWVPAFRLKQDVVPGRSIAGWFEAVTTGEFEIACAELCGAAHGSMKGNLIVHSQPQFDDWMRYHTEQGALLAHSMVKSGPGS